MNHYIPKLRNQGVLRSIICPNFPQGEDEASLETIRQEIALEVEKQKKEREEENTSLIRKKMEKTFFLQQQIIVNSSPSVKEFLHLWPALCITSEVNSNTIYYQLYCVSCLIYHVMRVSFTKLSHLIQLFANYQSVTNENLPHKFYAQLDLPHLMTIFQQKTSKTAADTLANLLKVLDRQVGSVSHLATFTLHMYVVIVLIVLILTA